MAGRKADKQPEILSSEAMFEKMAEALKAQAIRPNIYAYQPHKKQFAFHSSNKRRRLYIGGNRSGKTTGGIVEDLWWVTKTHPFIKLAERYPEPIRGRIVSTDFSNGIEKTVLPELARWCPVSVLRGGAWSTAYDRGLRVLHFADGGFIELMSYDQDLDKFAGTSRHFIHFDEEPPEDIYTECAARLIDTGGAAWITMTPVEGMTWVYDTLYEPGHNGIDSNVDVITVSMDENPHLNSAEVALFLDGLSADERAAREHGTFVQLGGLIYKDFDVKTNVMQLTTMPPVDWLWVASLDHGFNNPTCWLWHAISPDGQVITFREYYERGQTVDYHAAKVHEINRTLGRAPEIYVGDPSIRNTDPITGTSIHQEYGKYGIPILLGNNDVRAGITRVARYLKINSETRKPGWVISEECKNLIWEMQRYRWKTYASKRLANQNNQSEEPKKKDDHACDSARYFFMSRPELAGGFYDKTTERLNRPNIPDTSNFGLVAGPNLGQPNSQVGLSEYAGQGQTQWIIDEAMGGEW